MHSQTRRSPGTSSDATEREHRPVARRADLLGRAEPVAADEHTRRDAPHESRAETRRVREQFRRRHFRDDQLRLWLSVSTVSWT